ncbi:MAG TPA: hypothetical protein VEA18_01115 [Candidatus Kapabacteria bacterium]|nr:hypothetical protein [Candidatus Kapabacteria bacterium]
MPGIADAFTSIAKTYNQVIISSGLSASIAGYLCQHSLDHTVSHVLGADVAPSKADKVRMVFRDFHTGPCDCVFVTDTLGDVREVAALGVQVIAVTWGFHGRERLLLGQPYAIIDHPDELPETISTFFRR